MHLDVLAALEHHEFPIPLVQFKPQNIPPAVAGADPEITVGIAVPAIHDLLHVHRGAFKRKRPRRLFAFISQERLNDDMGKVHGLAL